MSIYNTAGYSFSIWIIIPVLIILIILTGFSWLCTRHYRRQQSTSAAAINAFDFRTYSLRWSVGNNNNINNPLDEINIPIGLNEEILQSYPKLTYSNKDGEVEEDAGPTCSICLGCYEENDTIRVMPYCGHNFHMHCVDCWLRQNCTCPICRQSPLAEQSQMPPVEVIIL